MENQPKDNVCTANCGGRSSSPSSSTTSSVNHPEHYNQHPSGVECIEIAENMVFPLGNAVKYVFRNQIKHENPTLDLKKALWYISRYVETLSIKAGIRGINFWSDKTRFEWKNKKSSEDKEWIHDVYVLISEAITVCASNGTGDIRRAMSEWMQCIAFERQSRRQPVGESEVGNSSGELSQEMGSRNILSWATKSDGKTFGCSSSRDQKSCNEWGIPNEISEIILRIQSNNIQNLKYDIVAISKYLMIEKPCSKSLAILYLWRAHKSEIEADKIKELNNAAWHIQCEISTATTTTK
jgi:hypothetical protein